MRTTILISIGTAIIAVAACADDRVAAPSAPRTTSEATPTRSNVASAAVSSAQGKPTDQIGFTKVAAVWSANFVVAAGKDANPTAVCPAGSTVISGGHHFLGYAASASPPWIHFAYATASNGWTVHVDNSQPGANTVNIQVVAYCAS